MIVFRYKHFFVLSLRFRNEQSQIFLEIHFNSKRSNYTEAQSFRISYVSVAHCTLQRLQRRLHRDGVDEQVRVDAQQLIVDAVTCKRTGWPGCWAGWSVLQLTVLPQFAVACEWRHNDASSHASLLHFHFRFQARPISNGWKCDALNMATACLIIRELEQY